MSIAYRPVVDGLSCIAVMLVILHHLNLSSLSGGFVGVDVFFVISGDLITAIFLAELKSGSFTFGSFYKRRVIRLAPAYFTVSAFGHRSSRLVVDVGCGVGKLFRECALLHLLRC